MVELGGPGGLLRYEVSQDPDGSPLLKLEGELDLTNTDGLERRVAPILAGSPDRLVVDVSGLEFADSSAIALLVKWMNLVGQVELRDPPELLRRVIERMGLAERLQMRP